VVRDRPSHVADAQAARLETLAISLAGPVAEWLISGRRNRRGAGRLRRGRTVRGVRDIERGGAAPISPGWSSRAIS
jgi:hypothetical protein